jgi:hypothetical protein
LELVFIGFRLEVEAIAAFCTCTSASLDLALIGIELW